MSTTPPAGQDRPTLTVIQGGGLTDTAWLEERLAQLHAEVRELLAGAGASA